MEKRIFSIRNDEEVVQIAQEIFRYQYLTNNVYRAFCDALRCEVETVDSLKTIPFLPIQFFKSKDVLCGDFTPQVTFTSSGTTGAQTSRHLVKDIAIYEASFFQCFQHFYGPVENYCVLGLLPSYLEREGSSLIYMVDKLIQESAHPDSGFYLYEHDKLKATLQKLEAQKQPTILFGVSYALLDLVEEQSIPLKYTTVIETGGMKGRKKELSKAALYEILKAGFCVDEIHSEYGMTELLSQAYASNGLYKCPPWMKVLLREETDPLSYSERSGVINVLDLANLYSCSFIATDDLGRLHSDGHFEVLGRMDHADARGCSQLLLS